MSIRKKVGVIISMNGSPYQGNFLKGFFEEMSAYDFDVLVFSSLSKRGMGNRHISGELKIFSLINFDLLDGMIVLPDTLPVEGDEIKTLFDRLHTDFNKPVVCVDYENDIFPVVNTLDESGMELVTDHMIEEHGCRDIMYVGGPEEHPHSVMRETGYRRSLEKHGIEYSKENVFYGSFWYDTGENIRDCLIRRDKLPDAIVCANDPMALSIIHMLEKEGYHVPDDVNVAGYDNEDDGSSVLECVTSCVRDVYSTGVRSAQKILELLGVKVEDRNPDNRTHLMIYKTCKCFMEAYENKSYQIKGSDGSFKRFDNIHSDYNFMQEDMIANESVEEYIWNADWYVRCLEPLDSVDFFFNDNVFETEELKEDQISEYTENMIHIFNKNNTTGKKSVDENRIIKREEINPELFEEHDVPSIYYFVPFHYYERCFGYMSFRFHDENCICNSAVAKLMRNLNTSFESLRRFINYQNSHKHAVKLYTENIQLSSRLIDTQEQLILSFAELTESKSGQTGKHVKRVSEYSRVLGEALGMDSDEVEVLRMASMMHDIGKLVIPASILEKPGKLTFEEFEVIKTHVTEGERLLHNSPGEIMRAARLIALEHHEKWNGKGYLGKKGTEIDYNSTIVAVADVYDALVSKRSYKEPMQHEEAYKIILNDRGEHFSPEVVDAFAANYDKILDVLKKHPDSVFL